MKRVLLATVVLAALSAPALAEVTVKEPWVRATASYQKSSVAFMRITSSNDARLVRAESPVAKVVEIHEMVLKNNVMKMQTVTAIDLPAGKTVELKPGSYMVMLTGLKQQIKEGDTIPIAIVVEGKNNKRETIKLNASAMTMSAAAGDKHMHDHDHAHMHNNEKADEHAQDQAKADVHMHEHKN
jgi:copper(I)-binding protein